MPIPYTRSWATTSFLCSLTTLHQILKSPADYCKRSCCLSWLHFGLDFWIVRFLLLSSFSNESRSIWADWYCCIHFICYAYIARHIIDERNFFLRQFSWLKTFWVERTLTLPVLYAASWSTGLILKTPNSILGFWTEINWYMQWIFFFLVTVIQALLQLFHTRKWKHPPNWLHLFSTMRLMFIPLDPRSGHLAFVQSVLREDCLEMD